MNMNVRARASGISIRTKLMVLLLGMAALGLLTIAAIAINSAQRASQNAQELSARMLRQQAEETLVQITGSTAKENDLILERVSREAAKVAAYAATLFTNPDEFHNPSFWSVFEHMRAGPDGQYSNPAEDVSSVFVPSTSTLDAQVRRDIEISAYLDLVLKPTLEGNPNVEAIYFATPRDVVRYYPNVNLGEVLPPDFRATQRVWYAGTLEKQHSAQQAWWTPAYLDATGLGVVTTAAAPVLDDAGDIIAVVGFDVTLTEMKSRIEEQEFLAGGYAFLIDDAGRAIALPDQGYSDILGRAPAADEFGTDLTAPNSAFEPIITAMLAGESGFKNIQLGNRELFVSYAPMTSAKWSLASVVEEGDVLASLSTLSQDMEASTRGLIFRWILPLSGAVIVAVILIGLYMTHQIVSPILQLASAAEEIRSGNWQAELPKNHRDEIGVLSEAFSGMVGQLHELVQQLEQRVAARTEALQRRATQLQTVAEIGRTAAALLDLDELLSQVTQLVSESFGFYHVGIFLIDDLREYAILRAANSQGGKEMLAHHHKLRVGHRGIVGYVTGTKNPRIALDVGEDAHHFQNPFLPETRSEMALPLIVGGELLGVIDVQSKVESAFSSEDVEVLQVLADQVAIALQNARLFRELQNNLRETRNLYKLYSQEAWSRKSSEKTIPSFEYDRVQVAKTSKKQLSAAVSEQLAHGQVVLLAGGDNGHHASIPKLIVPIMIQGQAIGFISLEKEKTGQRWSAEEIKFIESVTGQVSLTLENVRLLEETQFRAERERLVAEITGRMRETLNLESVLQTAVQEIGQALNLQEAIVSLNTVSGTGQDDENQ
jgi:GAF domain-containing protein/HAMP domain-containing protein